MSIWCISSRVIDNFGFYFTAISQCEHETPSHHAGKLKNCSYDDYNIVKLDNVLVVFYFKMASVWDVAKFSRYNDCYNDCLLFLYFLWLEDKLSLIHRDSSVENRILTKNLEANNV